MQTVSFFTFGSALLMSLLMSITTHDDCGTITHNASIPTAISPTDDCQTPTDEPILYPQEKHLTNVQQLTFGGDNAEAYFSFDSKMLTLQIAHPKGGVECDQIFYGRVPQTMDEKFDIKMISTGKGKTTCSYFLPGDRAVLYASTHEANASCPMAPNWRETGKYVWALYDSYEIYYTDLQGTLTQRLTNNNFYDAEATVSSDGNTIVFTSTRNGDIDLYTMNISGGNVKQITNELGYDGGAFFSPDGKQLVFRASRPKTPEAVKEYKDLLAKGLVAPSAMEIFVCNVDGSNLRQITNLGGSNWAPYFHLSQKKVMFSSNHHTGGKGFPFNLFMINLDGTGLEQITYDNTFDAFPMFSYDGKKLVFASNRNNGETRDTNIFIADWVD